MNSEHYEFIDALNYRRRLRVKDDETGEAVWKWMRFHVALPVADRATELEVHRSKRKKGVWICEWPEGAKRPEAIYVTCPHCAGIMNAKDHEVKEDGELHPCVVCPQCAKHVFIKLSGWSHGPLESVYNEEDQEKRNRLLDDPLNQTMFIELPKETTPNRRRWWWPWS
jgi:hypothetical protein